MKTEVDESSSGVNVGAIAGGVVGGVVLLLGILFFFLWRRRKAAAAAAEKEEEKKEEEKVRSDACHRSVRASPNRDRFIGGIRRRHGLWSVRLSVSLAKSFTYRTSRTAGGLAAMMTCLHDPFRGCRTR